MSLIGPVRIYYNLDGKRIKREGASLCPECGALIWDVTLHINFHEGREPGCTCGISPNTGRRHYDGQCTVHADSGAP